ncbi:GGDEF domain-containing protein [Shewanella sp. WXL01]|uniref:tetratricopeptide repeat-containing diguanylate cyclase n=1 Tax=Shewanella sp. WXL01 TaxID=2709721 RepID=UPI00143838FD|nr:GGDEF domain-containing protein [Shewanella sp. WXL01]NKF49860.1 GGDEF domain-containing protein [Shewanella sp. WXL01]
MFSKLLKMSIFIFAFSLSTNLNANYLDNLLEKADKIRSSNPEEFKSILTELEQSHLQLTPAQLGYYQYLLAYQKSFEGDFKEAISIYENIVNQAHFPKEVVYRANLSLVNIYAISKNWNKGLKHLLQSQQAMIAIDKKELLDMGLLVNSVFYNQLGQYELGLDYAEKLTLSVESGREHCFALQHMVESRFKLGSLNQDTELVGSAIKSCEKANEPVLLSGIYIIEADVYIKSNDYLAAKSKLEKHQSLFESTQYAPILAYAYSLFSQVHFALNNNETAESFALKTLSYAKTLGSSESKVIANQVLYSLAEQRGDTEAALKFFKQYAEADKAYLDDIKTKHLAFQLAQHRAAEQRSHIEYLSQQNNLLLLKQKYDKVQAENNRLFIALLILAISLLSIFAYRSKTTQAKLRHLAQNDGLTGLFNRRHFTQEANRAIAKCLKYSQSGSCILFDLDKFKSINDTYGHKTGDWVLKQVAQHCKPMVRKQDIFARIGGEEFCLFLPNCTKEDAAAIAEEYREKLTQISTQETSFSFNISGSFGVSDFSSSGSSLDKLIADADAAMYQAKTSGRNKVCQFNTDANT